MSAFGCLDSGKLRTSLDRTLYVLITVARLVAAEPMVVLEIVHLRRSLGYRYDMRWTADGGDEVNVKAVVPRSGRDRERARERPCVEKCVRIK